MGTLLPRSLIFLSLAIALLVCGNALADDPTPPPTVEMARARARACIGIAQATDGRPCVTQECVLAEFKASAAIEAAKATSAPAKVTEKPAIVDPVTGKRYTWREGFGYMLEGQEAPSRRVPERLPAGDQCYIDPVTGQRVCPYRR